MTFEYIIEELGGTRPASRVLGVPVSTIQSWKKNGVPVWRHAQIENAIQTKRDLDSAL